MQVKVSIYIGDTLRATRVVSTPCSIGRSKNLGLTVSHPAVSRNHCELSELDGTLRLFDNGSLNGTIYAGEMIEGEVLLADEDEFSIGEIRFVVQKVDAPAPTPTSSTPERIESPEQEAVVPTGEIVDETANTMIGTPEPPWTGGNDGLQLADDD